MRPLRPLALAAVLAACAPAPSARPPAAAAPAAPAPAVSVASPDPSSGCALDPAPRVLPMDDPRPGELHEVHDLDDAPALWAPAPPGPARDAYRRGVAARAGSLAPRDLLARQRAIYAAIETPGAARDAHNGAAVLEGRAGAIGPASCLEALLWERQAARYPMLEHPTEFGAFILRGGGRVRIYFSAADLVGQRIRSVVTDLIAEDVRGGYALVAHLHNHPFLLGRVPGDRMWTTEATRDDVAGALAPSATDVQFYRRLRESIGLPAAWVTNGLDTARFSAADFDILAAAE